MVGKVRPLALCKVIAGRLFRKSRILRRRFFLTSIVQRRLLSSLFVVLIGLLFLKGKELGCLIPFPSIRLGEQCLSKLIFYS